MNILLEKASKYAINYLENSRCNNLPFHSVDHTIEVFEKTKVIGKHEGLGDQNLEIVLLAALFHDLGISVLFRGHEYVSAVKARTFLTINKYPNQKTQKVLDCILSTQLPQNPKNILEKVLCDADLSHLSNKDYLKWNRAIRLEWKKYQKLKYDDVRWKDITLRFFREHKYHTVYGKEVLTPLKTENYDLLKNVDFGINECDFV